MFRLAITLLFATTAAACGNEPPAGRTAPATHRYHAAMELDLYEPAGGTVGAPTVVMVHGCCGDRRDMAAVARALSDRGALVVNASVRARTDGGGWPTTYLDVVCAYAWATAHVGDDAPVALLGWGDGGLMSAAVALGWKDIVGMATDCEAEPQTAGPPLLIGLSGRYGWSGEPPDDMVTAATIDWFGATPTDDPTAWAWGNPSWWVEQRDEDDVDITLIDGTDDGPSSEFADLLAAHSRSVNVTLISEAQQADLIQPRSESGAEAVDAIARALGLPDASG